MSAMKKTRGRKGGKAKGGFAYDVPEETLKRYMRSSAAWKLNWLEEANRLTNNALTPKEKEIRNRIRRGEL